MFTSFQLCKAVGIRRASLQQWLDRGFIKPSISKASGRGQKNIFSKHDAYRIMVFIALAKEGISQKMASRFAYDCDIEKLLKEEDSTVCFQLVLNAKPIFDFVDERSRESNV